MATGVHVLQLVAFSMPALASVIILTSVLRGAGDSRYPLLFTWIGFLGVRLPLAAALSMDTVDLPFYGPVAGFGMGLYGCWVAMQADIHVRGLLFLGRFHGGSWLKTEV
jgi:Na+-driven multidrug efflux pump